MVDTRNPKDAFPIHIDDHGTEMATIHVGAGEAMQKFTIHKWALVKASPYFANALTANFKEAKEDSVHLATDDPIAFKVFYQYIYSGSVHQADFYSKGSIPSDVLWLRTLRSRNATGVHPLLRTTYDRLRESFSEKARTVPSLQFVTELFDQEYPQQELEDYVAAHVAYWILHACGDWTDWVVLMESIPYFALAVAREITKRNSGEYRGSKNHPTTNPNFDKDTLFPAPVIETSQGKSEKDTQTEEMYGRTSEPGGIRFGYNAGAGNDGPK